MRHLMSAARACAARVFASRTRPPTCGVKIDRLESRVLFAKTFVPIFSDSLLVADNNTFSAPHVDQFLVNPVGIVAVPGGNLWVANNASGRSTTYTGKGVPAPTADNGLIVDIPVPPGGGGGAPTGVVYHGGGGFDITANGNSAPSNLIYATENGIIAGYNQKVSADSAIMAVDHSASGDVFKGLAIVGSGSSAKIYATDFRHNRIEVFDSKFRQVSLSSKAFVDPLLPNGYSVFGIQQIKNKIYVTYALQDPSTGAIDTPGASNGIINVFSTSGKKIKRLATGGKLNSPWGMVQVPGNWGTFNGDLLVGNAGDGTIAVYNKKDQFIGQMPDPNAVGPLTIAGMWGLTFGSGKSKYTLYINAGLATRGDGVLVAFNAAKPKRAKK